MYFANSPATLPTTRRNAKDRNARATEDGVRTIRFVDIFVGHFSVAGGPREQGARSTAAGTDSEAKTKVLIWVPQLRRADLDRALLPSGVRKASTYRTPRCSASPYIP